MKQSDLLQRLRRGARLAGTTFTFLRHGGKHDVYEWGGQQVPIPRHREINEKLAQGILRQLGIK